MKLELQNVPIGQRIGLALALPIAGLIFFSIWTSIGQHRIAAQMRNLQSMAEFAPAVSALTHELQMERGVSAGLVGGRKAGGMIGSTADFAQRLPVRHAATDQRRQELGAALERYSEATGSERDINLYSRISSVLERLDRLVEIRHAVLSQDIDPSEVTRHYTEAIAELISIDEEMLTAAAHQGLMRTIAAHIQLLHIKEQAGQERAIGTAGFAAGHFNSATLAHFIERIDRQRLHLDQFNHFASKAQADFLNQTLYGLNEAEVERMRRIVLRNRQTGSTDGINAAHWFDSMSQKIDLLRIIENRLASDILAQAQDIQDSATQVARRITWITLLALALTISFAALVSRGILLPLQKITEAMSRLAARDDDIRIEGTERRDEIGALARAAHVFRDNQIEMAETRERLRTATALRLHHQALSSIVQGVLITDLGQRVIYANVAFNQMFGFSASEFPDDPPAPLGAQQGTNVECLSALLPAFGSSKPFNGDLQCRRQNGEPFWCAVTVAPVLDALDQPTHLVGIMRDITESRQVEQELRIAATAFESLHGLMVTDARGIILRVNRAFTEMTGFAAGEAIGQTPAILKSNHHPPEFYADMWTQLASQGSWSGEIWDRRKNGEIYPKWQTISAVRGPDGNVSHYVAAFTDISERKEAEKRIHDLAFYDPLTQLPNRRLLIDRLQQALALSARTKQYGALLFIDLDQFKTLNDTLGHDMGDLLLIQVAARLQTCLRASDTAARLGGDEFVVMLCNLGDSLAASLADAETVGLKVLEVLNKDYDLNGKRHHSTPSIGITLFDGQEQSIDEVLKQADLAMYQSKAAGRNTLRFYDPEMQAVITARSRLEDELRTALDENQFVLHYQPQVDDRQHTIGFEALVRWHHPQQGLIPPAEFVPMAEETGLIVNIGQWVRTQACALVAEWGRHSATAGLSMAINVSASEFRQVNFVTQVLETIQRSGANPNRIKLEITESLLLDNIETTTAKMEALRAHGISFSLDDFGTGYSSLAYLKLLPIDQLKIDRSFIKDMLVDANVAVIAKSIVAIGRSLGLDVIAEGVETEEQRAFLVSNNCLIYQGFLFGKPTADTATNPS